MIDKIVIIACGKGTRLMPLTSCIPKLLININNDNMLVKIVNYWKQYCKKIIIVTNKEYNIFVDFYMKFFTDIEYKIKNVLIDDQENAYTICKALDNIINEKILITWCDVVPVEKIDFSNIDNNCIFISKFYNYKSRYYAESPNKLIKVDNYNEGNVIGIYYIYNFKPITISSDKDDFCDCFLDNFDNFFTLEVDDMIDIGDMKKLTNLLKTNRNKLNTRYFNKIEKNGNVLTKSSTCEYGDKIIKTQIDFYLYIKNNKINYPLNEIYDIKNNSFKMNYISQPLLYDEILKKKDFVEIYNLLRYLKTIYNNNEIKIDNEIIRKDLFLETITKIKIRNDNITTILNEFSFIKYVNNIEVYSFETIIKKIEVNINKFLKDKQLSYNLIHGDLNLSNIFKMENNKYIFIDPRGCFGDTKIYGLKYYELSKIFFSLFGFDELNNSAKYYFSIDNNNIQTNINLLLESINIDDSLFTLEEYEFIITLAVSIWIGLPFYFKNNISKLIGTYFYGLYIGTLYLENINDLIRKKLIKLNPRKSIIIKNSSINHKLYDELKKPIIQQEMESYENMIIKKPRGFEFLAIELKKLSLLVLHIKNNESTSMHCHSDKDTPMLLAQGKLTIKTLTEEYPVIAGDIVILNRKIFHQLCSYSDNTIVLEFEMEKPNKNDLIRYKDKYNREKKNYEDKKSIIFNARDYDDQYFNFTDCNNFKKNFLDSYILFKNGIIIFDENIKNDSVIIILEGCINVEGVYINQGSILRCYKIMNKNIIYIDDNFKYLIYNNI